MRYITGLLWGMLLAFPAQGQDTLLLRQPFISNGLYDSGRCVRYLALIRGDTSGFRCTVCESGMAWWRGRVTLSVEGWPAAPLPYRLELRLLARTLPLAARDFRMDSLRGISLGSLSRYPDLSIALSKQYFRKWGGRHPGNAAMQAFLTGSQLATDFNALLAPYSRRVVRVSAEKLSLKPKRLLDYRLVEGDTAAIPERILDSHSLWLELRSR